MLRFPEMHAAAFVVRLHWKAKIWSRMLRLPRSMPRLPLFDTLEIQVFCSHAAASMTHAAVSSLRKFFWFWMPRFLFSCPGIHLAYCHMKCLNAGVSNSYAAASSWRIISIFFWLLIYNWRICLVIWSKLTWKFMRWRKQIKIGKIWTHKKNI